VSDGKTTAQEFVSQGRILLYLNERTGLSRISNIGSPSTCSLNAGRMKGNSKGGKRGGLGSVPVSMAFLESRSSVDAMVFVCSLDSEWTTTQMLSMFSSVASVEYSSLIASNEISVEQSVEICRPERQVGLGAGGNDCAHV